VNEKIHETAMIYPGTTIGNNVEIMDNCSIGVPPFQIRRFRRTLPRFGVTIGDNVSIFSRSIIVAGTEQDTTIGNKVNIAQNVLIGHDSIIGDKTMLYNGTILNGHVTIGKMCVIGAGTTIRERITIGDHTVIGMGSIVTKDIPPNVVAFNKVVGDKVYCVPHEDNKYNLKDIIKERIL
jgi:UDP-3-O-[3-hydroxymyristoyl] glucosamine N-acyltransferase